MSNLPPSIDEKSPEEAYEHAQDVVAGLENDELLELARDMGGDYPEVVDAKRMAVNALSELEDAIVSCIHDGDELVEGWGDIFRRMSQL